MFFQITKQTAKSKLAQRNIKNFHREVEGNPRLTEEKKMCLSTHRTNNLLLLALE